MLRSTQHLLKARVSTLLGSLLLFSWTLMICNVLWQAASDENPLAKAFERTLEQY